MMKAITTSVSAAPHPRPCAPVYGDEAFWKISNGRAVLAPWNTFRFAAVRPPPMVNSSGAVSPAIRAAASRAPLVMPQGCGQHHGHRDAGLARAESVAGLAEGIRDELEHLLARPDDDRQHQAAQCQRTGQAGVAGEAEVDDIDGVDEQAHDDRGHARHDDGHEPDDAGQETVAAVLVDVDRREDADRHGYDRGQRRDQQRSHDRRPDAADTHRCDVERDVAGQEAPADGGHALGNHRVKDESQRDDHDRECDEHERGRDPALGAPPGPRLAQVDRRSRTNCCCHHAPRCRAMERATIPRAMRLTMIVSTNRSTPSPRSAARNTPDDSPNWLAMTAGML